MSTPLTPESEWSLPWTAADHHHADPEHRKRWEDQRPLPWLDPEPEETPDANR